MIKVMVAEDELPIQRNLSNNIERLNPAFQVSVRASNGREAIEALKREAIQVIFLDINMPVIDGMEVLKYIYDNDIPAITVILSGYQEFAYAQQAVRYGAKEYLLKPLKKEQLSEILKKIEQELTDREYQQKFQVYEGLITGKDIRNEIMEKSQDKYYMAVFYAGSYQLTEEGYFMTPKQRVRAEILKNFLAEKLPEQKYWLVNGRFQAEWVLFIKEDVAGVEWRLKNILQLMEKEDGVPVTGVLNRQAVEIGDVYGVYEELARKGKNAMLISQSSFHMVDTGNKKEEKKENSRDFSVVQMNIDGIFREMSYMLEDTGDKRMNVTNGVKRFFRIICARVDSECSYEDLEEDILRILEQKYTRQGIEEGLQGVIMDYFHFDICEGNNKKALAWEIRKYLELNYSRPVSNRDLSEMFGFVPLYLRRIFREYYEMTPSEYLQKIRLEKARELLMAVPEISLRDIAEEVGYNDSMYFSKLFKKQNGLSPTEYRKVVSNIP